MKKLILLFVLLGLPAGSARAGIVLSTSNPPGTPLSMTAGTTSGPMLVNVVSDNPPNDIMAAWNVQLEILPDSGASGTLTFHDPASASASPPPPNYVFGGNGFGIEVINGGSTLIANDFFDPSVGPGVSVPGSPGANLLQMDFLASSNASGLFGIFAVEGQGTTWSDPNLNTLFFTNVPDGTGTVRIGEVLIAQGKSVPEPSSLVLLGLASTALAGCQCLSKLQRSRTD